MKPYSSYLKRSKKLSTDGYKGVCKDCRRKEPPRVRDWSKRKNEKGERDPIKVKAQAMVRDAVRQNKLDKPSRCQECNKKYDRHLIHGHHDDYSKPLEVEWLCHWCHSDRHTVKPE